MMESVAFLLLKINIGLVASLAIFTGFFGLCRTSLFSLSYLHWLRTAQAALIAALLLPAVIALIPGDLPGPIPDTLLKPLNEMGETLTAQLPEFRRSVSSSACPDGNAGNDHVTF